MSLLSQSLGEVLNWILRHVLQWLWRRLRECVGIGRCWGGLLFALAR